MQLVPSLVLLALWSGSAHAFYPYRPSWLEQLDTTIEAEVRRTAPQQSADGIAFEIKQRTRRPVASHSEQVAREAARLADKYPSLDALVRRKNAYSVVTAVTPSTADAAGVNQDGADYSYFVQVGLGSKGTKLYMLIDTGAGSSWVMGTDCTSEACKKHDTFGKDSSDTVSISDKDFSVAYGSGKVKGKLATDTLSVAGLSMQYKFGLASTTSDEFSSFAFDGILGLSMGGGAGANFLETLASSGAVKSTVFAVSLSRAADDATSGEIKFGGTNSAKYTGDITYTPISAKGGDWAIDLDDMSYDGNKAGVGGKLAYIDTGTTYIFGPASLVDKLHSVVEGATKQGSSYSVPCDSTTPITVTFSGVDYEIPAKDWIAPKDSSGKCSSNIYGQEVVKDSWLMGATFLKSVYAVFDKDGKRIGFAKPAGEAAATSSSSSSSPSASASASASSASTPSSASGSSSVFSSLTTVSSSSLTPSSNSASTSSGVSTFSTLTSSGATASPSKPALGLTGQETETTGTSSGSTTSEADATKTDDKDSGAAPGLNAQGAQLAAVIGAAALMLLV